MSVLLVLLGVRWGAPTPIYGVCSFRLTRNHIFMRGDTARSRQASRAEPAAQPGTARNSPAQPGGAPRAERECGLELAILPGGDDGPGDESGLAAVSKDAAPGAGGCGGGGGSSRFTAGVIFSRLNAFDLNPRYPLR